MSNLAASITSVTYKIHLNVKEAKEDITLQNS